MEHLFFQFFNLIEPLLGLKSNRIDNIGIVDGKLNRTTFGIEINLFFHVRIVP